MKTAIKKIISALGVIAIIAIPTLAKASISFTSPVYPSPISYVCSTASRIDVFETSTGRYVYGTACDTSMTIDYANFSYGHSLVYSPSTYTAVSSLSDLDGPLLQQYCDNTNLSTCLASAGTEQVTTFSISPTPPTFTPVTLFGGTTNGTGGQLYTSSDLISQTANALNATASGIYPIVALVIGLFLTAIISTKIMGMYKQAGKTTTSTGKKYNAYKTDNSKFLSQKEISAQFPLMKK